MSRIMTIWIPKWPVQRRLVEQPELRKIPLLVCRREPRGVMTVVSMALGERLWRAGCEASRGGASRAEGAASPIRHDLSLAYRGLSLAETLAAISIAHGSKACRMAEIEADDPVADRMVLEGIARWCRRFSPIVAVESSDRPERIHVDVTGTARLFGGEESVVRTAVWTLASRGLRVRAAVADTAAAASVASTVSASTAASGVVSAEACHRRNAAGRHIAGRHVASRRVASRRQFCVVPPGQQATQLAAMPVAALGKELIGEKAITSLAELGVATIGQLLRLPRKSLASRFGERLERRIAEFLGTREEPLDALRDDAFPTAECRLAAPAATLDAIRSVIDGLVGRCVAPLAARGHGVTALQVRLESASFEGGHSAEVGVAPPVVIDIGLFRPSTSVKHLVELVELRLSRMHLPGEVESVAVEVIAAGAVTCRQKTLFGKEEGSGDAATDASNVEMLLDRLAGRLGRRAVFEPKPVADAQPEHAWTPAAPLAGNLVAVKPVAVKPVVVTPATGTLRAAASKAEAAGFGSRMSGSSAVVSRARRVPVRPIWLAPRPVRLETVSIVPDGPPLRFRLGPESHRIVSAHGPERIETAWWRGECVRRDYYVVETETGSRWWLFRRLRDGAWFLHGQFA